MPRTHFLYDRDLGRYFRTIPDGLVAYLPDAQGKADADLFSQADAITIANAFYGSGAPDRWQLVEASASEHALWRCQRAGRVNTPKRAEASRTNGKLGGRPKKQTV